VIKRVSTPDALSIDCIQLLVQTRSIKAYNFALSRPLSAYLQTRSITASKCISNLAQLWPPSASPNSLNYGLQVRTIMASKCISPKLLDHGLQAHLESCSIMESKCISKLAQIWPPGLHVHGLQVHWHSRLTMASKGIFKLAQSQPWSVSL